jgi:peroxiredoxin Q/BCP
MPLIEPGKKAPAFTLKDQNGKTHTLHDYQGRPLVLYFYPKDDTPGCTRESCAFRDQFEDFRDAGAEVIGVSSDSPASHKRFAEKHSLPFTLLSDSKGEVRAAFRVPATLGLLPGRVTYVIDKEGVIRHAFSSQLNATQHVAEALKVLTRLR